MRLRRPPIEHKCESTVGVDNGCVAAGRVLLRAECTAGGRKGHRMGDAPGAYEFAAYLPRLAAPVRIGTYADAQVFVRRWAIRDKDRSVRELARRMERANSSERMTGAMRELRRELAARGMLHGPQSI